MAKICQYHYWNMNWAGLTLCFLTRIIHNNLEGRALKLSFLHLWLIRNSKRLFVDQFTNGKVFEFYKYEADGKTYKWTPCYSHNRNTKAGAKPKQTGPSQKNVACVDRPERDCNGKTVLIDGKTKPVHTAFVRKYEFDLAEVIREDTTLDFLSIPGQRSNRMYNYSMLHNAICKTFTQQHQKVYSLVLDI